MELPQTQWETVLPGLGKMVKVVAATQGLDVGRVVKLTAIDEKAQCLLVEKERGHMVNGVAYECVCKFDDTRA